MAGNAAESFLEVRRKPHKAGLQTQWRTPKEPARDSVNPCVDNLRRALKRTSQSGGARDVESFARS